eukprot:Em0277g4a
MATSDKLSLQAMTRIATSINNTYISVTAAAAQDSFGNTIVPILPGAPLKASAVILDNLPPTVMQYNIDMNLGTLVLYADGTVQAVFSPASYTLQNAATAPTATFTLLTSTLTRFISFTTFTIGISTSDLNVLKAKGICTSNTSCFLTYTAGALVNSKGIRSNNLTVGIPPAVFIRDTTSPTLINFSQFNAATSILMLNFSEPVIASSFVAQGVTLQSLFSGTTDLSIYTLMGGSTLSTGNVLLLTVSLSSIDTNVVKLNPYICTTRGNCYVTLNSSTITDVAGNQLTAQTIGLLVDSYIYDVISPVLVNFTVDMDGGNGTLFFSKPVSATGFLVSAITFLGKPGATNTYRLTSSTASASSGQVITVFFSMYDLNNIKNSAFAKSIVDTYLAIDSSATTDLSLKRNSLMPITIFNPLQASKYIKDQTPPVVQAIVLDLNSGLLLLSFNEPVNTTTINFSNIAVTLLPGSSTVALTGGSVASIVSGSAFTVTVSLTPQDLLQLKLSTTMVAITGATISIGANMVTDIANNANFSIVLTNASVIPDTASPALLSFTLDITTSTLYLTFSDVVAPTYPNLPFDPTGITLQASKFRGSNDYFTLTSQSQTNSPAGYIIVINLNNDLVSIINNPYFGSSVSNTYITIQAGTIQSIFGQNTEAIINGKALQASLFTLQSAPLAVPQTMYTLTSSSMATVTGTNLTILLSNFDLSGIQTIPGLAMSRTTTYISFTSTAIRDISHNLVAPVLNGNATQAAVFVPDTTAPFVTSFILDLNTGSLMLTFSKLVNIPALAASQIRLQNRQNVNLGITQSVQLTGSLLQSTLISNVASLWLPVPVLQTFSTSFGTLQSNTYLALTALTVSDLSSNPVIPILSTDALPPSAPIKADTSPPALVAFDLNLGTSTLSLVWSKPVNASTLSTTQITIQGSITAFTANSTYRLTGSQALSPSSAVLNVTLSILDGIFLRMATALPPIEITPSHNCIAPISSSTAKQALYVIPDTSQPQAFSSLQISLPTPITLQFSEAVNVAASISISLTAIDALFVQTASTLGPPAIAIRVSQLGVDFNQPAYTEYLLFDRNTGVVQLQFSETLYGASVQLSQRTFQTYYNPDFAGNSIKAFTLTSTDLRIYPALFIPDSTPSTIIQFMLYPETGTITVIFDEPVSSVIVFDIALQNAFNATVTYQLTTPKVLSPYSDVVTFNLSYTDIIQFERNTWTSKESQNPGGPILTTGTYVTINTSGIMDYSGLGLTNNLTTTLLAQVVLDTIGPLPVNASLDLDLRQPALYQTVSLRSSTQFAFAFTNNGSAPAALTLTFTEPINASSIILSASSTYLNVIAGAVSDGFGVSVAPTNLARVIVFSFDQPVQGSTFNSSMLTIQSAASNTLTPFASYTFSGAGSVYQAQSNTISLTCSQADIDGINGILGLAISQNTTYISLAEGLVRDTSGAPISLTFSDTVLASSINAKLSSYILTNALNGPTLNATFAGAQPILSSSTIVNIYLSFQTRDYLLANMPNIATTISNTYLSIPAQGAQTKNGLYINAVVMMATNVIPNTMSPSISAFAFDFNSGQLNISFDSSVQGSTFNISAFLLQSAPASPAITYSILSPLSPQTGVIASISLSVVPDLSNLKLLGMCTSAAKCYLSFARNAFQDVFNTPSANGTLPVGTYIADTVGPSLSNTKFASFNLGTGTFVLEFNEPVQPFVVCTLRLTASSTTTSPNGYMVIVSLNNDLNGIKAAGTDWCLAEPSRTLLFQADAIAGPYQNGLRHCTRHLSDTSGNGICNHPTHQWPFIVQAKLHLAVRLGPQELTMLKELVNLGQSINITFVMLQNGTVLDTYGNPSVPTTVSVSTILQDTARPILTSFDLDMNNGVLVFYFSQVVIPTTFQPTFVTLQNYYSSPTANKTLTGGVISNPGTNTRALNLQLTTADIFFIKSVSNLAKTLNTTFLSTIQATAFDLIWLQLYTHFPQCSNKAHSILYFDEPVSSSSFVPTTVILQRNIFRHWLQHLQHNWRATVSVNSAVGSGLSPSVDSRRSSTCCKDEPCAPISPMLPHCHSRMGRDVVGNILRTFHQMLFHKLVDPASIQYTGLSLYDGPLGGSSVSLTGGTATTMGNTLTITLTSKDLNNIKLISSLCRSTFACWVRLSSTFIRDLTSNPVEPVLTGTLELTKYTPQTLRTQTMPPYIVGFSLNMNTKSLIISFNEVVLTSSFNAPAITFASDANSTYIYTLVAGDATLASSAASSLLNLTLTESAMNKIKAACLPTTANYSTCIGVTAESTYLSAAAGLVSNLFMLPSIALAPPIPATVLVSDTLPPNVVQFVSLDLNTFTASIKFSEPVQLPVNLSGFSLTSAGGVVITLHSGASSYLTTDPTVIQFSLSPADTLAIKSSSLIDRASFKVLTATSGAAVDLSGVSSLPLLLAYQQ